MTRFPPVILLALLASAGCAPRNAPATASGIADPCLVPGAARATLDIFLPDVPTAAAAPVPRTDAERFVYRQLYATLVRIDCTGAPGADLARRWTGDADGRRWRLELDERRFAGGERITAQRVVESLAGRGLAEAQPWLARVEAPGPYTLAITLAGADSSLPEELADPSLAIAGPAARRAGWPEPTGPFRVTSSHDTMLVLESVREGTAVTVRVRRARSADPRDVLGAGGGLLVTRDPATLAYAERIGRYEIKPLAWERVYALVAPAIPPLSMPGDSAARAEFRAQLARDAVAGAGAGAARGAEPPYGATVAGFCRGEFPRGGSPRPRVVYPLGDPVARGLAERIVAIAPARLTAVALPPAELAPALAAGRDAAYVMPFDRTEAVACDDLRIPAGATVEPLVDTRAHLIVRRDGPTVTVDGDGVPRILP
ncbi:MAG TPA: hypothetical protein VF037_01850 [Gemmatimonadales bacterium]